MLLEWQRCSGTDMAWRQWTELASYRAVERGTPCRVRHSGFAGCAPSGTQLRPGRHRGIGIGSKWGRMPRAVFFPVGGFSWFAAHLCLCDRCIASR